MPSMPRNYRPIELLRYAGLFVWFCAGVPLFLPDGFRQTPLDTSHYVAWAGLHVVFGFMYWNYLQYVPGKTSRRHRLIYLLVLTGSALATTVLSDTSIAGIYLTNVAALLPWMLPLLPAALWLVAQNIGFGIVMALSSNPGPAGGIVTVGLFTGLGLFVFIGSVAGVRQREAREALRGVNQELRATQALLAQNTRIAERVRIARELHDLVGHHLTALTLNLEVVTHLVDGKALTHVQQAHSLAKLLLADVREVVSDMRQDDKVDLAEALRTLVDGSPGPTINLDFPSNRVMIEPDQAQVLLRAAQEIITNSMRHARANNLWIRLSLAKDGVAMSARDDGRGVSRVEAGNGLRGMSERLLSRGGKMEIESSRGAGFTLHLWMPMEG